MKKVILPVLLLLTPLILHAQITAQWRGPQRNGIYPETGLLKVWPENGPRLLWSASGIYDGYASPTVTDQALYVAGKKDSLEVLTALNLDGKQLWQIVYGNGPKRSFPEARSTPTVDGDRLYLISGAGEVVCVSIPNKKILWKVDGFNSFGGKYGRWEVSESPLIVDDKVFYTPAGNQTTLVALDKMTGKTLWTSKSLNDASAYVSPICVKRGGKKIIVNVTAKYIFGVDAANGDMLWAFDYAAVVDPNIKPAATDINCDSPVYSDGKLFVTSGYNHVGVMLDLSADGNSVKLAWQTPVLDTHHGHVVLIDGHIYGSNWIDNRRGNWCCLDWNTGQVVYETTWETKGSIIEADGMLYCYEEKNGNLALVKPTPEGFNPVSTFQITQGKGPHWAHPVIKAGVLYVRHGDVLMAYDIKK